MEIVMNINFIKCEMEKCRNDKREMDEMISGIKSRYKASLCTPERRNEKREWNHFFPFLASHFIISLLICALLLSIRASFLSVHCLFFVSAIVWYLRIRFFLLFFIRFDFYQVLIRLVHCTGKK